MRNQLAQVFLACALSGGFLASPKAYAADEVHWTITGQNSVTFDWRGSENSLRYGLASGNLAFTATASSPSPMPNSSSGPFWEAKLTGLQENTLYYYKIGTRAEMTFRTPPPRGTADFWFAVEADIGDEGTYGGRVGPNQAQIASDNANIAGDDRPRFVVVPGDLAYGDQHGASVVDRHFNDVMVWSEWAAYMPIWGNHEYGSSADDLQNYEGRFDFPNSKTSPGAPSSGGPGEDWYWFDYGTVRIIAFPEPYSGAWSDWATKADAVMAQAQADASIQFIITFGHRPAYSSGADHGGDSGMATMLRNLHVKYSKFLLNLVGHSHHYERSKPELTDGIVNIITGGGGSSLGGLASTVPAWSAYRINHVEHVRIHVTNGKLEGFAVCGPAGSGNSENCTLGSVIDRFEILGGGGPPPTCTDSDGDGYGSPGSSACSRGSATDCNDSNAQINPGATEVNDGRDNDCDGVVDETNRSPVISSFSASPASGLAPLDVRLTCAGSDPDGDAITYTIGFGDGSSSVSGSSATHRYASAGNFSAACTARDAWGKTATATAAVGVQAPSVNVAPVVNLSLPVRANAVPFTIMLTANAVDPNGDPMKYDWTFGDGEVLRNVDSDTVEHTYSKGGIFIPCVIVRDAPGLETKDCETLVAIHALGVSLTAAPPSTARPAGDCIPVVADVVEIQADHSARPLATEVADITSLTINEESDRLSSSVCLDPGKTYNLRVETAEIDVSWAVRVDASRVLTLLSGDESALILSGFAAEEPSDPASGTKDPAVTGSTLGCSADGGSAWLSLLALLSTFCIAVRRRGRI